MANEVPEEIPLGTVVLGEKIGEGGFGQVFKAYQYPIDRTLAIKLLDPHPFNAEGSEALKRFMKEANILLSLRHEYITPIYGVGEYKGQPYILMEYFNGMNLNQAREVLTPGPNQILPFLERVTSALDYAHRCNICHRDIKPSNLLTKKGDARVVDFGIAKAIDPEGEHLTKKGATPVGSDAYVAPELIAKPRTVDPRCDIFSLGACWFWLLTGMSPKGVNWENALRQVDKMTEQYEAVILKTLNQIETRYQSMAELLIDVKRLRAGDDPDAIDREIDDDAVTLLAAIFEQHVPHSDGMSTYQLEQRVSQVMNKFTFSMALRVLQKWLFIEIVEVEEQDSFERYTYKAAVITDAGQRWVERNRKRVEGLLPEARKKADDDFDDDIPF